MTLFKQIILFALCLQLTVPSAVDDLLRFPSLISHYLHHNDDHETLGFADFLIDHYVSDHEDNDKDHQEHHNLPFRDHHSIANLQHITAVDFQQNFYSFTKHHCRDIKKQKIAFVQDFYPSNIALSIWRPPQLG